MEDKQEKKLPYRFTCPIPYEVVGHKEMTKLEEEEFKKAQERVIKKFNLNIKKDIQEEI